MRKDCSRGNWQLDAKALAVNNVAEGKLGGPKFLKTYRLGYLFRNATNLSSGIFISGDIARGNLASYYVTSFQRAELRNPRPLDLCGIFMNGNSDAI